MIIITGYEIQSKLYESNFSLIYRGRRQVDDCPIIIKCLKQEYPSPEMIARFRLEYQITHNLNLPGTIQAYSLENNAHSLAMILEDFGAISLAQFIHSSEFTFSLDKNLVIAIEIINILDQIHQKGIIHKDINPSNIILNPQTEQLKIIDFGMATILSRENSVISSPHTLEGTLAYISPEQTGRMNRSLDYRSDFYSLGVTLYELFTQQRPFDATDPLELIHCHLAKQPISPQEINPKIPPTLAKIILKLMAKMAEDRYQSAAGIRADLVECLHQLQTQNIIIAFPIAQHDISTQLQTPQKLYGREAEIEILLAAFERVSTNHHAELMLVCGYSGVGKSALVREVYKPITQKRGYFISGKFDQYQHNIPYFAIVSGFSSLIQQLLSEPEEQLKKWRSKLLNALGKNGQLIIDFIPELELVIGKQPELPELTTAESQNRFNLVFEQFVQVFAQPEHPLVLFLDDLQWADIASLKLMNLLMSTSLKKSLLLIGAYRDNEIHATHFLLTTINEIKQNGTRVEQIKLQDLQLSSIIDLVAKILNCKTNQALPLAQLVLKKTSGNPFFITIFINTLKENNLLKFDFEKRHWHWKLEEIIVTGITNNVIELLTKKLKKLAPNTQKALKIAACVGNLFELQTLTYILDYSVYKVVQELQEAILAGLIIPVGTNYKLVALEVEDKVTVEYKFIHDQIQQAAYSLLKNLEKKQIHYQIGKLFKSQIFQAKEQLFDIVNQLNLGQELITEQNEKDELAKLNFLASQKAKASIAYENSFEYIQTSLNLLSHKSWEYEYSLTLGIYQLATETAYLTGDFEQMEIFAQTVLIQAKTLLDQVKIYEIKIQAYASQMQFSRAIDTALEVLKILNISFTTTPTKVEIQQAFQATAARLSLRSVESLIDLPPMTDPLAQTAMKLLASINGVAYQAAPELFSLIILKLVDLSIEYGNSEISALAYGLYAILLGAIVQDIETSYKFGQLAINLLKKQDNQLVECKVLFVTNTSVFWRKTHLRETIKPLETAYQIGINNGEIEFAGYSALHHCDHCFFTGMNLLELESKLSDYRQKLTQLKDYTNEDLLRVYHQTVLHLINQVDHPGILVGEVYNEEQKLPILEQENNQKGLFYVYFNKFFLNFLFGEYHQALINANQIENHLKGGQANAVLPLYIFYDSLCRLSLYNQATTTEKIQLLKKVHVNQQQMKRWAHYAPMNYQHKFILVEAEKSRVLDEINAADFYDQAIALAEEQGYLQESAIAYERAAQYYLSKGKRVIAKAYLQEARYAYLRWGATAKVQNLEQHFSQLLQSNRQPIDQISNTHSSSYKSVTLDQVTLMKASEVIASELVLDRLLSTLLNIAVENAGAQTGCLILHNNGQFKIVATTIADQQVITIEQPILLAESHDICQAMIHYVARTQKSLVENNASSEGQFVHDVYIQQKHPKSILCTPLIHQGKLIGLLYLENNLICDAFQAERVELLNLLSTQMAIAIENSRLVQHQEELNNSLQQERQQITRILERITDGFIGIDRQWKIVYINQKAEQILEKKSQQIKGKTLWEACSETMTLLHEQQYREAQETGQSVCFEAFYSSSNYWLEITVYPDQEGLSIFFRDITGRKQMEEKLISDAQHDALTGLPNRLLLSEHLQQMIQRTQEEQNYRYAVLFLDIDRFKVINESLGHLVGDQLLIAIAQRLKGCITQQDIIARLGGDEFIILLDNPEDEVRTAARIQMALNAPFNLNGYKVFNTVSIGIVSSNTTYTRPEELLQSADIAMYQAKAEGRARYVIFDTTMQERATSLLQLETDLRLAIEVEQLCVYYQPIVALKTGKLAGFEALVRWLHPKKGIISPIKFIPLAEETGLIIPIGQWVLQQACYQLKVWQEQFPQLEKLTMSVNLSVKQFSQVDLIPRIDQILSDLDLPGHDLKLEITESALMNNFERTRELLLQLKSRQIQLCIDDFGTGYSSLSYLHQFPVDILKIDRSFVRRLEGSNKNDEIVRTIIALSHNMSIAAIAEGIETSQQLAQLRNYRCEYGQGYFFDRPLDALAATDFIAQMRQW